MRSNQFGGYRRQANRVGNQQIPRNRRVWDCDVHPGIDLTLPVEILRSNAQVSVGMIR